MKLKDIETKLKKEQESVAVPDILERVKKAPINKLLSGETPAQAFQKKLAVRLLVTTTVLLIAAIFCFAAMLLFTNNDAASSRYYISLRVEKDGVSEEFGIVASEGLKGVSCIDYQTGSRPSYRAIEALYDLRSEDKVFISVIGEDSAKCAQLANALRNELSSAYGTFSQATTSTSVNSDAEIALLQSHISALSPSPLPSPAPPTKDLIPLIDALI